MFNNVAVVTQDGMIKLNFHSSYNLAGSYIAGTPTFYTLLLPKERAVELSKELIAAVDAVEKHAVEERKKRKAHIPYLIKKLQDELEELSQ